MRNAPDNRRSVQLRIASPSGGAAILRFRRSIGIVLDAILQASIGLSREEEEEEERGDDIQMDDEEEGVPECCVPICGQKGFKDEAGEEVSFHPFPKERVPSRAWMAKLRREGRRGTELLKIDRFSRPLVCSKHFSQSDFLTDARDRSYILREGAVPSAFDRTRKTATRAGRRVLAARTVMRQSPPTERAARPSENHHGRLPRMEAPGEQPRGKRCKSVKESEEPEMAKIEAESTCDPQTSERTDVEKSNAAMAASNGRKGSRVRRKKQFCDYAFDCRFSTGGRRDAAKNQRRQRQHPPPTPPDTADARKKAAKREGKAVSEAVDNAPAKLRSAIKVLGKSPRFRNETPEEETQRLARYAARYRRYMARESDEQRERRLQRGRELRQMKKLGIPPEPRKKVPAVGVRPPAANTGRPAAPPAIDVPASIMDPEEIVRLQRQYVEFKEYVRKVMPRDPIPAEIRTRKRRTKKTGGNAKANPARESTPAPQILYSDDPIDLEIALLETAEETFVPVQVINQTCEDFDDMLEFESM